MEVMLFFACNNAKPLKNQGFGVITSIADWDMRTGRNWGGNMTGCLCSIADWDGRNHQ